MLIYDILIYDMLIYDISIDDIAISDILMFDISICIPYSIVRNLKIPQKEEIRLKHGLFLTLDLETKQIKFTRANLIDMKNSGDIQVAAFLAKHKKLLEKLGIPDGTVLGLYYAMVPQKTKTPIPCFAAWSLPQMLETTANLQQCVKTTVKAGLEYFFILAEDIGNMHSMIYIHQTQNSLCIHRMDENVIEDELAICANNLQQMSLMQDAVEMYVCTNYLK